MVQVPDIPDEFIDSDYSWLDEEVYLRMLTKKGGDTAWLFQV
jgi:hypothetical protein